MTKTWHVKNKSSPEGYIPVFGGKKAELVREFKKRGLKVDIHSRQDWGNWYFIVPRDFGLELTKTQKDYSNIELQRASIRRY